MRLATMITRFTGTFVLSGILLFFAAPVALEAQRGGAGNANQTAFLHAVGEHFGMPQSEVRVLARWSLPAREIPVVLRLAKRAGVSPDVVVAQRQRGEDWMEIARGYSLHAGDFHVPISGSAGFLNAAYERFNSHAASEWRDISLSDAEVVGLVNMRFLSRALKVRPVQAIEAMGDGRDIVGAFVRLKSGG